MMSKPQIKMLAALALAFIAAIFFYMRLGHFITGNDDDISAEVYPEFAEIGFDFDAFTKSATRLIKRTRSLAERANEFDQESVLESLGPNASSGFLIRLDDQMISAGADFDSNSSGDVERSPQVSNIEFEASDQLSLRVTKGESSVEDGIWKCRVEPTGYLWTEGPLKIERNDLDRLEIRLRTDQPRGISILWGAEETSDVNRSKGKIMLRAIADDEFRTYHIDLRHLLQKDSVYSDEYLRSFYLVPQAPGDLEIDFIRFVTKDAIYARDPQGVVYEKANEELRRAVYSQTGQTLSFHADLPAGPLLFATGISVLRGKAPTTVTVRLIREGNSSEIIRKEVTESGKWSDVTTSISGEMRGQVEIEITSTGPNDEIVFFSNPRITGSVQKRMNVIVILEDALRADHLSCYGNPRKTSLTHDRLAANGVRFERAVSQAPFTRPSCPSIMTGLYPTATGVWHENEILNDRYVTLAEILRNQGYATAAFIQNTGNAGPPVGLHQGYESLFDQFAIGASPDSLVSDKLWAWLDKNEDRKFFAYLHFLDPHGEYNPPEEYRNWYAEASVQGEKTEKLADATGMALDPLWVEEPTAQGRIALYDGEIANTDASLERLVQGLASRGVLDNTLLVIISDHGEFLGEEGRWSHHPPGKYPVLHVPLILHYPEGLPRGLVVEETVQMVDVLPTILDSQHIRSPELLFSGESLLPLIRGENIDYWNNRMVVSEEVTFKTKGLRGDNWGSLFFQDFHAINSNCFRWESFKLGRGELVQGGEAKLYNFSLDPREEDDLLASIQEDWFEKVFRGVMFEFQSAQSEILKAINRDESSVIRYDPEVVEQLEALGYLGK